MVDKEPCFTRAMLEGLRFVQYSTLHNRRHSVAVKEMYAEVR